MMISQELRNIAPKIVQALEREQKINKQRDERVLTIRQFPTLPGYTSRVGTTMMFMTVEQALKTISDLIARGESWNAQAHGDGVYVSFEAQTFGATLDPKLTSGNLYWSAHKRAKSLREAQTNMEHRIANYPFWIAEAAAIQDKATSEAAVKIIEEEEEEDRERYPWLKKDRISADGEERMFRDRKISPTVSLCEDVQKWVENHLRHAVTIAGTFREPTIRFMSLDDRSRFTLKWGGKPI